MVQLTKEQQENLKRQIQYHINDYLKDHSEDTILIAEKMGRFTVDVITALNDPDASFNFIHDIYNTYKKVIITPKMVAAIKGYLHNNSSELFKIAEMSQLTPEEIVNAINSDDPDYTTVDSVHKALQSIQLKAQEEMSQKVAQVK